MIVDTHAHINKFEYENLDEIIDKLKDYVVINNGINEETNKLALELAEKNSNFYAAIGYHPENIHEIKDKDLKILESNINNSKVVAIGEIGLDYHYRSDNKKEQQELFEKQLELAEKYNKPVIVHSRDAIEDTFNILSRHKVKADIHCFSSSLEMAERFIKHGCLIGIGGSLTFKNNKKTIEVVKNINLNKILLETDSPYLAPEPLRGTKNDSTNLKYVISLISKIKNISEKEVIFRLNQNAIDFFGLEGVNNDFK